MLLRDRIVGNGDTLMRARRLMRAGRRWMGELLESLGSEHRIMTLMEYLEVKYGDLAVVYTDELNGGGTSFGQDYVRVVRALGRRTPRVLEWCAGPGFIGFSLLANGLCEELTLVDINPAAIAACNTTIERAGLTTVRALVSDCLGYAPKTESVDLIVANAPMCGDTTPHRSWNELT